MITTGGKYIILLTALGMQFFTAQSQALTEDHPLYYKKRGNRLEGIYSKPLNFSVNPDHQNATFIVVGYTLGKFYFVKNVNEILQVYATHDSNLIGRSSANDLSYKYRLDAELGSHNKSLSWPLKDVVWHLAQLSPDNMGIFGYDEGMFIPISISNRSFTNDSTLRVHLTSKVPVKDIKYRLLDRNGRLFEGSHWTEIKVNGKNFVRAGQLVIVPVANISEKCVFEIQAINRDTGAPIGDNFNILAKP